MDIVIYGAGKLGKELLVYNDALVDKTYSNIFFYDNNKNLPRIINGIERLDSIPKSKDVQIIIASNSWNEIYKECIINDFSNIWIYNSDKKELLSYLEMCRNIKCTYSNNRAIIYENNKNKQIKEGVEQFLKTGDLYENITEICLMLSNMCNYACFHKKCPASLIKEKEILPSSLVYEVFAELAKDDYSGVISFHVYNEPLMDPRLFLFMQKAKKIMPNCKLRIYSNGYYLNQQMVDELIDNGMDILQVTGYGDEEYFRLMDLNVESVSYTLLYGFLDDRLEGYEEENATIDASITPCNSYFVNVNIFSNGEIGTCCLDYRHKYGLGNLYEKSLRENLNSEIIREFQKKLLKGDRSVYSICRNCKWIM